jgi:hypothetical protein
MSKDDKININNIIEKINDLDTDALTDEKVGQKNVTDDKTYRILLSNSDNNDTEVAPSNKSEKLLFNPNTGTFTVTGNTTATKFITLGGKGTQFVKGDGSLDSTTYITSESLNGYLPLTGGTIKNGSVRNPLTIDTTNINGSFINFATNGVNSAYVGYNSSVGAFIEEAGIALKLKSGVATLGSYIMLHSGNYNSYAPTLTGTGASGTWNIDISGNAATASIANVKQSPHIEDNATSYPILTASNSNNNEKIGKTYFVPGITITPKTKTITATAFNGNLIGNVKGNLEGTSTYATYLGDSSNNYSKSTLDNALADKYSFSISRTKNTVLAAPNGSDGPAEFRALVEEDLPLHNHSSNNITSLIDYSIAETNDAISTSDTLNTALGKLEYKADLGKTAYDIVFAANNNNTIENLTEILKVLEGINDTDTIQAIINKYLPLSGGTMSGNINFGSDKGIYVNNSYAILALGSKGKFTGHPNDEESYTFVGTTNYNTIIRTKNKLQVYKNSNRYNIIDSSGGTISGSLTWEIPDYSVIPIIRNIKFTETTEWDRKILAMQVDGVEQFSLGAYGSYKFPLNSENPNKADYLYLGFNAWNGNNLRIYPDKIKFGDNTIWHSGNCNFLPSTNKDLTPAGSEIANTKIGEIIGYQAINKSTLVYANNGYIKTDWGKMELAGSSILSFGTSGAYTQLFISAPSSSRGDGLTNEMMFYNNHGSDYYPEWTRVVTNRNYTKIFGNPFKINDQSYNIASDGSISTGDIYLEMWRGTSASWKLVNNSGTFRFQCNYTDTAASYYDALTITYNSGNIWTKGRINIAKTDSYENESVLPTYAKLIIGNVGDYTYGLYFSRNSI